MFKNLIKLVCFCSVIATFLGCHQPDGTYVVYKVQPKEDLENTKWGLSDSLYNVMKSSLMGTKYEVKFHDKFVSFKSLQRNTEALLPKKDDKDEGVVYKSEQMEGITKVTTELKVTKDNELICRIFLQRPLIEGDQPTTNHAGGFWDDMEAQAVCYLSKID